MTRTKLEKLLKRNFCTSINNIINKMQNLYLCGACVLFCRSGEYCQCDSEQFSDIGVEKCRSANETGARICSGNGECDCGVCQCNLVPGTAEKYYGQYCQCDNFNCEQSDNKLCGGRK